MKKNQEPARSARDSATRHKLSKKYQIEVEEAKMFSEPKDKSQVIRDIFSEPHQAVDELEIIARQSWIFS